MTGFLLNSDLGPHPGGLFHLSTKVLFFLGCHMIRPSGTPCWVFRSLWSAFCPRLEVLCANLFPNPSSVTYPPPKPCTCPFMVFK